MTVANGKWDTTYEWKVVTLLGIGFGLVGLDRWIIAPLGPTMAMDLGLSPGDIGYLVGALGLTWGVFAIFSGRLADSIGHRKILIPAILVFSLMSGFSGMASGMVGLIFIRALMGAAEGAYTPTSFTAVASAAKPERRGILQGAQQCGFALFGLALGPIIATQLLQVVPSWRWVFWIVAIPGFIVAALLYFVLKEPEDTQGGATVGAALTADQTRSSYMELLKTPNIVVAMLLLFCTMSCVFVLSAMVPGYLEGYIGFTPQQQGAVLSGIGFGGFIGQFGIPGLSDRFGRRPMAIISFIGATVTVWIFFQLGANPLALFLTIFAVSFFQPGRDRADHRADRHGIGPAGPGFRRHRHCRRHRGNLRRRHRAGHRGVGDQQLRHRKRRLGGAVRCGHRHRAVFLPQGNGAHQAGVMKVGCAADRPEGMDFRS